MKQLFCNSAIHSLENSLAGSMTIGDHYTRSDSCATGKFPRKTLDSMVERSKFELDKFVNYCTREGFSTFYTACQYRTGTCMCTYCSLKCAQLEYGRFDSARQMCQHIKGWRLQSRIANDYAASIFSQCIC